MSDCGGHLRSWTFSAVSVDDKSSFLSFIGVLSNLGKSDKELEMNLEKNKDHMFRGVMRNQWFLKGG